MIGVLTDIALNENLDHSTSDDQVRSASSWLSRTWISDDVSSVVVKTFTTDLNSLPGCMI